MQTTSTTFLSHHLRRLHGALLGCAIPTDSLKYWTTLVFILCLISSFMNMGGQNYHDQQLGSTFVVYRKKNMDSFLLKHV